MSSNFVILNSFFFFLWNWSSFINWENSHSPTLKHTSNSCDGLFWKWQHKLVKQKEIQLQNSSSIKKNGGKRRYLWILDWQVRKGAELYQKHRIRNTYMSTDVRSEPPTGSSAMTRRSSLPVSPSLAWWRAVPTPSVCVLSTRLAWAARPECLSRWLPWTRLIAPAWEVLQPLLYVWFKHSLPGMKIANALAKI